MMKSSSSRKHVFERIHRHSVRYERLADAAREHELDTAVLCLLVVPHELDQRVGLGSRAHDVGDGGWQARVSQMRDEPVRVRRGAEAQPRRETKGKRHADGDAFAMEEALGIS